VEDLDPRYVIGIVGTVLAFFLWLLLRIHTADKRRARALEAVAPLMGFTYQPKDNSLLETFERYRIFRPGSNPWITNVLSGQIEHAEARVLDYSCHAGGKTGGYDVFTVAVLRTHGLNLPYFAVNRAVPGFDQAGSFLEAEGVLNHPDGARVEFPSDPAFSKHFVVRGRPAPVSALLNEEVRCHLMRFVEELVGLEGEHETTFFTRRQTIAPDRVRAFLEEAAAVHRLLARRASAR
jgi:hypothetical protein